MRYEGIDRRGFLRLVFGTAGFTVAGAPGAFARRRKAARKHLVMLDPGHGGIDPGAVSESGVFEKDIVLATARKLARLLEATKRYRVHLTRSGDEFIPLHERVERARAVKAELFLSIHVDSLPDEDMRGASVFTLSEQASDREAAAAAARENMADLIGGIDLSQHAPEVSKILFDLARRQTNNLSIRLARQVVDDLGQEVRMLHNSHRSAGFAVLKAPDIPSALVEIGCLTNRKEERLLQKASYQRRVATGLLNSVNDYFDTVVRS